MTVKVGDLSNLHAGKCFMYLMNIPLLPGFQLRSLHAVLCHASARDRIEVTQDETCHPSLRAAGGFLRFYRRCPLSLPQQTAAWPPGSCPAVSSAGLHSGVANLHLTPGGGRSVSPVPHPAETVEDRDPSKVVWCIRRSGCGPEGEALFCFCPVRGTPILCLPIWP